MLEAQKLKHDAIDLYIDWRPRLGVLPAPPRKLEAVVDAISRAVLLLFT